MNTQHKIVMLRISFWVCAAIDLLAAIQLSLPQLWASMGGYTTNTVNTTLDFSLYTAAALMSGWTLLLIWADRKLQRKSILLITVFPVVPGLALNNVWAIYSGLKPWASSVPELILQLSIIALFLFSYFNAPKENV